MGRKARTAQDPFAFSLGGLTAVAGFAPVAVTASDRFRTPREARSGQGAPQPGGSSAKADRDCVSLA